MKKLLRTLFILSVIVSIIIFGKAGLKARAVSCTQTHVVSDSVSKNSTYSKQYFSGLGFAIELGQPDVDTIIPKLQQDMIIPGLKQGENMVPQGIAYYPNKNQVLISAYYNDGSNTKKSSMIFVLDFATGRFIEEYRLKYNNNDVTGHVGGIAVSGNNIYVADEKYIYHLRAENMTNGFATFTDRKQISGKINGMSTDTSCAYVSITDNVLWTGNFYDNTDTRYKKPADSAHNTNILGFKLTGNGDGSEWDSFKAKTTSDYIYYVPNGIENIQSATVTNNQLIMVSSFGRKNNSTVYFADVSGISSNLSNTTIYYEIGLPMMEGFFIKSGNMFGICESAAYFYNGYDNTNISKNPTDVVWCYKFESDIPAKPQMICYDFFNSYISCQSDDFYLGYYNRICTSAYPQKEIDETPHVFYDTIDDIKNRGLLVPEDFGISAPDGYRFVGWKCNANDRIFYAENTSYSSSELFEGCTDDHIWMTAVFEQVLICYDFCNTSASINNSKGFYFGEYNRVCTTNNANKTIGGTPHVYYDSFNWIQSR